MAVSTDTIQTLLRQRQDLREALLELRKEIETLDASSLDLVNKNIKSAPPAKAAAPTGGATPTGSVPAKTAASAPAAPVEAAPAPTPAPTPAPPSPSEPKAAEPAKPAPAAVTAEKPAPGPAPEPAPDPTPAPSLQPVVQTAPEKTEPVLTTPAAAPAEPAKAEAKEAPAAELAPVPESSSKQEENPKQAEPQKEEKPKKEEAATPAAPSAPPTKADAVGGHDDLDGLLEKARGLSDYLLDHPSKLPAAELGAFDAAISVSEAAKTPAEKTACYHTLQAAYRKISAGTFAASGVSGTTLQDSEAGAPLLWTIPFALSILIIVVFPLLLLARHLAGEMFTDDFASDVTWSIGLVAAFLWGTVGALTLLALNIALAVYRRRFDGGIRLSPGLRGALGGLTGGLVFLALEVWVTGSDAATDFALDLAAFAGGLLSAVLFASLQSLLSLIIGLVEPAKPKPSASGPAKK